MGCSMGYGLPGYGLSGSGLLNVAGWLTGCSAGYYMGYESWTGLLAAMWMHDSIGDGIWIYVSMPTRFVILTLELTRDVTRRCSCWMLIPMAESPPMSDRCLVNLTLTLTRNPNTCKHTASWAANSLGRAVPCAEYLNQIWGELVRRNLSPCGVGLLRHAAPHATIYAG